MNGRMRPEIQLVGLRPPGCPTDGWMDGCFGEAEPEVGRVSEVVLFFSSSFSRSLLSDRELMMDSRPQESIQEVLKSQRMCQKLQKNGWKTQKDGAKATVHETIRRLATVSRQRLV